MVEPPSAQAPQSASIAADHAVPPANVWGRLKHHKVLQWSLAYLGAALALAHAQDLLAHTYHWPELVGRLLMGVLIVGFPVAIALAWYHGHKGLKRVGQGELMLLAILLVIGAGLLIALVRPSAELGTAAVPTAQPVAPPAASVAVVPFVNLTGDPSKEYFSDGMAEELIAALSQVPGLKVPARTSSFAYKGRNVDIRRIAQDLGVRTILEGSVRSAGEQIRVTAQLVDATNGYHLWSRSYTRQFSDVFKLQDELAAAIVEALQGTMSAGTAAPARAPPTQDIEAYQLYLQARSVYRGNEQSLRRSVALFDQALARDPHFARAFAGRAESKAVLFYLGYALPDELADAEQDARSALALDSNLPEALGALGTTGAARGTWLEAESAFRAALSAGTSDPRIRARYGNWLLDQVGQLRRAQAEAAEAYRLAPADNPVVIMLAATDSYIGRDADAVRLVDLAVNLGLEPTLFTASLIYGRAAARSGRYQEAATHVASALSPALRKTGAADVMRLVYSARDDSARVPAAREALRGLVHKVGSREIDGSSAMELMQAFAMLGALDEAYALANQRLAELELYPSVAPGGYWGRLWLPEMRPFRQDPRFQTFVGRLKLIDYWKRYGPPDDCELDGDRLVCR
jgi:TolB-like protein/Flp pilus assembly protein TadD